MFKIVNILHRITYVSDLKEKKEILTNSNYVMWILNVKRCLSYIL